MSQVDLHLHTTTSDGNFSPPEIVAKAAKAGLKIIAITDHDALDGIVPALAAAEAFPGLRVIPGVEISTGVRQSDVHLLGYFIDYTSPELKASLQEMRQARKQRARGMIDKLGGLGIHINWARVKEIAGSGSIGRPHIAQAMLEKGYITSLGEAFIKYIGRDGPAYVERIKVTPQEAVKLILKNGGLPVLAHPLTVPDPEVLVEKLKAAGLVGIESYYGDLTAEQVGRLNELAGRHNLIVTGGSDYHGLDDSNETMIGDADVPLEVAEQLIALHEKRVLKAAGGS